MDWQGLDGTSMLDQMVCLTSVAVIVALTVTLFFSFFSSRSLAHYLVCRLGCATLSVLLAIYQVGAGFKNVCWDTDRKTR
jgi:hypothetical protein